jgi:hypothetical protein
MAYVGPEYTQGAHKELSIHPRFNAGSPLLVGLEGYWPCVEGGGQFGKDISQRQCSGQGTSLERAKTARFSQALSLVTASVLSIPRSQITQHCTDAGRMTFSIWMNSTSQPGEEDPDAAIVNFGTTNIGKQALYVIPAGEEGELLLQCTFDGKGNVITLGDETTVPDGFWHNYTCIYNNSTITGYVDGVLKVTAAGNFTANNGENTSLGFAAFSYVCKLWGFGVWSRVLTPVEIYNLWRDPYLMLAQPPVLRYNGLGGARIFDLMPFLPM